MGTVSHWRTFGIGASLGSRWDCSLTPCRDFSSDSDGSRRILTQPSLQNALGFSWSLYLEPTTFRYRRKPSALSPAPSVHHACHTTVNLTLPGTAENKEAIWIDLIIIYLFILVGKKNYVQKRCRHFVFSSYFIFGLLSSSAYMSFMYILYDISKAGSIVLLSAILWTGRYWLISEQYALVSRNKYPKLAFLLPAPLSSRGGNQHISPHRRAPGRVGRMFALRRRWLCFISKDYFPAALNETINPHTPKKSKEIRAGIHVRSKV